jgi:hypothetical protein
MRTVGLVIKEKPAKVEEPKEEKKEKKSKK